jgi:hypothetical protein
MTRRLANLMAKAQRLESRIAAGLEGAVRRASGTPAREPLEMVHAIVDTLAREVQPAGRGRQVFPFNQVHIAVLAPTPRAKARLEVAIDGPPTLRERIVSHLQAAGCSVPSMDLTVSYVQTRGEEWMEPDFDMTCARLALPVEPGAPAACLELTVTHGVAARQSYTSTVFPVSIGRGEEVRDSRQRLLRTNDLVFVEGGGAINDTVSRRHARIARDGAAHAFRLYDEGSAQGTSVIRRGTGIPVPRGTRGLRLQSGDEIVLGRARVRVRILQADASVIQET